MAAGAPAPALEKKAEAIPETVESHESQPVTLKHRIERLFRRIFEGREEHLGWRQ
ncbi:MAG: hypothetical protein WB762_18900 [Candidatus Sulfotelmatobacter sp.]